MGAPWKRPSPAPACGREGNLLLRAWASCVHPGVHAAAVLLGCSLWGVVLPPRASAECPTSTIQLPCAGLITTTAAAMDTSCDPYGSSDPMARASFDLSTGTIGFSLRSYFGGVSGGVHRAERYILIGPPAGTPIALTLSMPVTASISATGSDVPTSASGTAVLELDGVVVAQASETRSCHDYFDCTTTGNLSTTLSAEVKVLSGQEFQLVSNLTGSVSGNILNPGSVRIDGSVSLGELPPGVTLVSCHDDVLSVGRRPTTAGLHLVGIAPNPARGSLRVTFRASAGAPVTVTVLDVSGRVRSSTVVDARTGDAQSVTFTPSDRWAAGVYVVRVARGRSADARAVTLLR